MRFTYEDTDLHTDSVLCEYLASTLAWGKSVREDQQGLTESSEYAMSNRLS